MGIQVVNSSNQATHLEVVGPDGKRDEVTIMPGRQTLPEGWTVVDDFIERKHIQLVDPEEARLRIEAATEAVNNPTEKAAPAQPQLNVPGRNSVVPRIKR